MADSPRAEVRATSTWVVQQSAWQRHLAAASPEVRVAPMPLLLLLLLLPPPRAAGMENGLARTPS